jgi:predicted RNA methylase
MPNTSRSSKHEFRVRATRVGSRKPVVGYDPTPHHMVSAMLELAAVTASDLVYDLGSGDGRIAIAAAKRFGARAVGIEQHPARIEQARNSAAAAGVDARVRFLQQDLFDTDLKPATVITLFLLPEANLVLRPKMRRDLAAGTRIVSYIHEMGDWKPKKARYALDRFGRYHRIYLWTVP